MHSHKNKSDSQEDIVNVIEDIIVIKAEIVTFPNENDKKIDILVKVQLKEINNLKKEMDTNSKVTKDVKL